MKASEILFSRRSIRKYVKGATLPKELIEDLIHAAMCAPSARNKQPWHFIAVSKRENLDQLANHHPYGKMLHEACLAVLVCGDLEMEETESYLIQNCAAATQNLLLAAHAAGLGAVWLGVHSREDRMQMMRDFFKLPPHIVPISLISIGYPNEVKPRNNNFNPNRLRFEQW